MAWTKFCILKIRVTRVFHKLSTCFCIYLSIYLSIYLIFFLQGWRTRFSWLELLATTPLQDSKWWANCNILSWRAVPFLPSYYTIRPPLYILSKIVSQKTIYSTFNIYMDMSLGSFVGLWTFKGIVQPFELEGEIRIKFFYNFNDTISRKEHKTI